MLRKSKSQFTCCVGMWPLHALDCQMKVLKAVKAVFNDKGTSVDVWSGVGRVPGVKGSSK